MQQSTVVPLPIMPRPDPLTPEAAVLDMLRSAGASGLDLDTEIVPRLAERGIVAALTLAAAYDLEARGVVYLDGNQATLAPAPVVPEARALAAALGFLPNGDTGSDAERIIAERLDNARLAERERLAVLLRAKADDANDTAARLRRTGDQQDTADAFAGQARVWHRAADIAIGNAAK